MADKEKPISPMLLLKSSALLYGLLVVAAVGLDQACSLNMADALLPVDGWPAGKIVIMGLLGSALLLVVSYLFEDIFPTYRALRDSLKGMIGSGPWWVIILLALFSGVAEELFFRGALQPLAGIWITSLFFGAVHLGPGGRFSVWSIWAMLAGFLLGYMVETTGSLWPAIICHVVLNGVSMGRLKLTRDTGVNSQAGRKEA